ncbi:MAG: adenylate kinase family protein [Methanomicrobiaceae archaeon]|nr:adenylate kinase family protein [Methanomicrobiaceae archaeon]
MMWGITGTPGTGKSSIARELEKRGFRVGHVHDTVKDYVVGDDPERGTRVVDVERWAEGFGHIDGIIEGHIAHYLPCNAVVVLRCRPDLLEARLASRGYPEVKIRENVEAEALDVILIETLEVHPPDHVYELDTTSLSVEEAADRIEEFIRGGGAPSHGTVDWSGFLGIGT